MQERRKPNKKHEIVLNSTFLMSVILLLISAYVAYLVKTVKDDIKENYSLILFLQTRYQQMEVTLYNHLGWHNGKND